MGRKLLITALLVLLILNSTVAMDPRYTALNFGNNHTNFIMFKPDMEPLQTEFTICSWLKSFLDDLNLHTWVSYAVKDDNSQLYNEIMIGDDGTSFIFDVKQNDTHIPTPLRGNRTWYHYCTSWSFASKTQTFYLNGREIGHTITPEGRKLGVGGYLAIGSDQDSYGGEFEWENRFGGELYKLNFFSKELNSSEVIEMSRSMCEEIEETYGEVRHIKWEEIVQRREYWHRNVTNKETGCGKDPSKLWELLRLNKAKVSETEKELEDRIIQLNERRGKLEQIRNEKAIHETRLQEKEQQLTATMLELEQSKCNASKLATERDEWKGNSRRLILDLRESKENSSRLLNQSRGQEKRASKANIENQKMVKKLGMYIVQLHR